MSSDIFSSLVEKGECNTGFLTYIDVDNEKWRMFAQECLKRRFDLCIETDKRCVKDKCSSWQLIQYIKYGVR